MLISMNCHNLLIFHALLCHLCKFIIFFDAIRVIRDAEMHSCVMQYLQPQPSEQYQHKK